MRSLRSSLGIAALLLSAPVAILRAQGGLPINLQLGIPQGEFAENVSVAGGFGIAGLFPLASEFGLRAGFDLQIYGSERRTLIIPAGPLGTINADVSTTNAIVGLSIGAQLGLPSDRIKPYIGGALGFSNFNTHTSATGENSSDVPFASNTNASDNAFSKHLMGGMYFPLASGSVLVDLGARYTWNGESVRYLTKGDITEDGGGNVIINIRETRADLLTVIMGVTIRFGGANRK